MNSRIYDDYVIYIVNLQNNSNQMRNKHDRII
jgi:hypothetical protein